MTNPADVARFHELGAALADAAELSVGDWVRRCVLARLDRLEPDIAEALDGAAAAAAADVSDRLRTLVAKDLDDQPTNPLSILRSAVRYPTEVLRLAAVPLPEREQFDVANFPDDVYSLTPASFADVDERLHEPGMEWGAAKAFVHLQQRRDIDARGAADDTTRPESQTSRPVARARGARRLVAGVDSSTQSTKVELRDIESGEVVALGRGSHPPTNPPVSEQDPSAWWTALREAFAQVSEHVSSVVAIAVGGQQHGLVVLDEDDQILRPAKLWNDTTSAPQADRLRDRIGIAAWVEACGLSPVASFTITKLAWVADNEPQTFSAVRRVLLPHDWLTFRLTGRAVTDRGDASGTGWFDPVSGRYLPDLLALIADGAESLVDALPEVLQPTETAGTVLPSVAAELGLGPNVVVGPGTGDNMAAALGLGLQPGDVVISLGTSGTAYAVSDEPARDQAGLVAGFADASGRYLPLVATLNATKVTDTVARWLGVSALDFAQLALAADVESAPVLVPYFDGERSPNLPDASGEYVGLRNSTSREQLAWAAHAGVLCGLLDGVEGLASAGAQLGDGLFLIGGGARSAAYRQITADLWGRPIVVPDVDEAVAAGAAAQAAAVVDECSLAKVARRWKLGTGMSVAPGPAVDAAAQARTRYSAAARRNFSAG